MRKTCKKLNGSRNCDVAFPTMLEPNASASFLCSLFIIHGVSHYKVHKKETQNSGELWILVYFRCILSVRDFLERIGGFRVTSSPACWWTVNKRSLISSLCLSTSICSFHHCYLCLPRLHENHLCCRVNK